MKGNIQLRAPDPIVSFVQKSPKIIISIPFLTLSVLLTLIHINVFAQPISAVKPVLKFQHISTELSNNQVFTIQQDRLGFFWIGTLGGLHRFKGEDYDLFVASKDSTSLQDSRIEKIFEDKKGNLWIGTQDGISRYNRDRNNFDRFKTTSDLVDPQDPYPNKIKEITEDSEGKLWIVSQHSGLFYFNEDKQSFVPFFSKAEGNPLVTTNLNSICADQGSVLWIGTINDGLKKLNTKTKNVTHYSHDPGDPKSIAGNYIASVVIDQQHNVWVGTNYWGIDKMVMDGPSAKFIHYKHDPKNYNTLGNDDVRTVFVDSQNNVWSCNENGGLNLYNPTNDNFFCYRPDPVDPFSISSISIWCMYEDREGRLWFGSSLDGIDVIDKDLAKFDHYFKSTVTENSLNNNIVRHFYEDESGNLWIATDGGGLNFFDRKNKNFKAYKHNPSDPKTIRSNAALSICEVNGDLWVATWQGGINVLDRKKEKFTPLEKDNPNLRSVFYLLKDSKKNIWAATYEGGITRFDLTNNTLRTYLNNPLNPTSLSSNVVPILMEDSDGNIWAGTQNSGINLMEKDKIEEGVFQRFAPNTEDTTSLQSKLVNDIFQDSKKNIWIATSGGLSKFFKKKNNFRTYTTKHGLASDHIKSIIEDKNGYLWIGTTKGISKYDPKNESFINYDNRDGLQIGEFSRYCAYKTQKGELLFGGTQGFNAFMPDSIQPSTLIPPVYITGLRVFNKAVSVGDQSSFLPKHITELDELTLPYTASVFTLEFIALNNMVPDKNQYAYRLEGLESQWNYMEDQHSATYTNLDPGEYFFHVKASNNDGVWGGNGRVLKIIITPPFWKTWWFKALLLVSFITLVYLVIYNRVRHLRKKNLELEARVNDRTAQLRGLIKELQEKQDEIETTNEELTSTLEDLVEQKGKVETINNELKLAHEEVLTINNQLDERVHERTLKLVKANQELDRFVYSASHDLSAPLKSILGLIQLTRLENKNEELTNHLEHMQKSVLKLEAVINSLTQFSRNMGHALIKQEFVFDDMIEEVLDELKYPFHSDKVKIIKRYNKSDAITSDYLRLKIILSNLISNALKYKNINHTDSFVEISFSKEDGRERIHIKDNGIGISKANQLKVFDMFFRATMQSNGSGLGLYIVKETVEKLGGEITVDSNPGCHTMFTVIL